MSDRSHNDNEEIYSKVLRAGRRTYFFDVRSTRADDYYLTITESKKHTNDDGSSYYKKHKIYLYKEDFINFAEHLEEITQYIIDKKGEEVISDTHQPDFKKVDPDFGSNGHPSSNGSSSTNPPKEFTDVSFDDI
ncbi:MAG: PUR family DNA/RNA-binding protein [Bacteroidota bacterium]|nr:PUR family DNA/RNA-binding protein [Bacteroidota bacterium]MDX5403897.1 PUR family DNA/RNA-binding protein [Bacteroidota bacterium]MDX5428916.1 PUR family DNA/RNA-binding protein [Bacteroidota bacterium]MDX5447657.1 PUR family DNA/RNA-binding protein [Bacteroidota bacterium]MDX5506592.1 PUR family DNA/RNA-binding protein [Bacteroidota bacterium]